MKKSLSAVKVSQQREPNGSRLITDFYDLTLDSKSCGWTIGGIDSRETTPASSPKAQPKAIINRKSNTQTAPINIVKFKDESFSFFSDLSLSATSTPLGSLTGLSLLFHTQSRESTPYSSSEDLMHMGYPSLAANYKVSEPIPIVQPGNKKKSKF